MSHDYHEALPGYHPDQILHDGCRECEHRAGDVTIALAYLDAENFRRAWRRAADLRAFTPPSGVRADNVSAAEAPLLDVLWSVQVQLESVLLLGTLPKGKP